jgi:hypothetical protein
MKKPLCVRNKFPDGSKTVTQITEGLTLLSSLAKSGDGLWPVFASGEGVINGAALDNGVAVVTGGTPPLGDCSAGDSPTT